MRVAVAVFFATLFSAIAFSGLQAVAVTFRQSSQVDTILFVNQPITGSAVSVSFNNSSSTASSTLTDGKVVRVTCSDFTRYDIGTAPVAGAASPLATPYESFTFETESSDKIAFIGLSGSGTCTVVRLT